MTNKRKKRIRQLANETGRSYCSTLNALRTRLRQSDLAVSGYAEAHLPSNQPATRSALRPVHSDASTRQRRHPHGHKLLVYGGVELEHWHEQEAIWNARNAKAPTFIRGVSGNELVMMDQDRDDVAMIVHRYEPDYVPRAGERVFVELTEDRAHVIATAQIALEWCDPEQRAELDYHFATRDDAVRDRASSLLDEGYPDLIVVTSAFLDALAKQRRLIRASDHPSTG